MSKQFWAVIIVIALVFVGIFALTGHKSGSKAASTAAQPTNHVIGTNTTNVTLVEYGDYECPYCEGYYPVVQQVQNEYKDKIAFQFRNFPLVNVHQNAFAAARAAEAAGLEGKFWEMHDMLYSQANWQAWTTSSSPTKIFTSYATQLGLDATKFQADYASSTVNDLINADMAAGNKLNISGTPTFFINGKQTTIAANVPAFEKVINDEIAKQAAASKKAN